MTDKDNILVEDFFKQAAQQQIEDNGFTERVMQSIDARDMSSDAYLQATAHSKLLCRLWTLFCVVMGVVLFFVFGGWQFIQASMVSALHVILTTLEVFVVTAPTAEIPVNLWMVLLLVAFVLVYLPYQTARKLSSVL